MLSYIPSIHIEKYYENPSLEWTHTDLCAQNNCNKEAVGEGSLNPKPTRQIVKSCLKTGSTCNGLQTISIKLVGGYYV